MTTVAFIGLGNMGGPMAKNLLKNGFQVRAFDLVQAALDALAADGAYAASTAQDAPSAANASKAA